MRLHLVLLRHLLFAQSIPRSRVLPLRLFIPVITGQIDRQPDTTQPNTTGQRRNSLVGFVR